MNFQRRLLTGSDHWILDVPCWIFYEHSIINNQHSSSLAMIQYTELPPSAPLLPFIECFWILKSHSNFFKKRELIIPGGRIEMMFNLGSPVVWIDSKDPSSGRAFIGSYILGPRNRPFFVEQDGLIHMVGVRFRHGGLSPFIHLPMSILINEVVQADQVLGNEINGLTCRLCESDPDAASINLNSKFFRKKNSQRSGYATSASINFMGKAIRIPIAECPKRKDRRTLQEIGANIFAIYRI